MNITKTPYAQWLEEVVAYILEKKPVAIGIVAMQPDGEAMTSYYGVEWAEMKIRMAYNMQMDAMMDVACANAGEIVRAAEEQEDGEEERDE